MSQADAWMPLYIGDYLAATSHMEAAEHGGYLLLIMHYWRNGGLPTDERHLRNIAKMTPGQWASSSSTILGFFVPTQAGYSHARIDRELAKAKDKSEKAKASVAERERKRQPPGDPTMIRRQTNDDRTIISSQSQSPSLVPKEKETRVRARSLVPDLTADFEAFYAAYPNKKAREAASKAYAKARTKADHATIMAGLEAYRLGKPSFAEWAHPASWLNAGRWADQYANAVAPGAVPTSPDEQWRQRLRSLFPVAPTKPFWSSGWGPKPGELGCQVPPHILAEFDLGQSEAA